MTYMIPPAIWNINRFTEVTICKVLKRSNEISTSSWFHNVCSINHMIIYLEQLSENG